MKITCTQQNLARGLAIVGHAIATRSSLPIITNVKLETVEGYLRLSATNLELGIQCLVEAAIEEEGCTTLPAKVLTDFATFLPHETITITTNDKHESVIESTLSHAMLKGTDATEFPTFPQGGGELPTITIEAALLKEMVASVAFAASTDTERPHLTAIFLEVTQNTITCAAADSFRLAMIETQTSGNALPALMIPAKTLKEIAGILPAQGEVTVSVAQSQVIFLTSTLRFVCRILEGTYVNFRQMLPRTSQMRAVMETRLFSSMIKTAALFASDLCVSITFRPKERTATVEASSDDLGTNTSSLKVRFFRDETNELREAELDEIDDLRILFNARYLSEALTAISDSTEVAFELRTGNHAGIMKPVGTRNALYLLMPLQMKASSPSKIATTV